MVILFVFLLIIFLAAFFGIDLLPTTPSGDIYVATVQNNQVFLSGTGIRIVLVAGILFCEFVIIFTALLDRMLDTLKLIIRPLLTLVPLGTFLYSTYNTFRPIVEKLLPTGGADVAGVAQIVAQPEFNNRVLGTIGAMLLYLIVAQILGPKPARGSPKKK